MGTRNWSQTVTSSIQLHTNNLIIKVIYEITIKNTANIRKEVSLILKLIYNSTFRQNPGYISLFMLHRINYSDIKNLTTKNLVVTLTGNTG